MLLSAIVIVVIVAGGGIYLATRHHDQSSRNQAESNDVVKDVGQLYILPTNESPTVAAIQNVSKLAGQDFFRDAKNGDYVVVYPKAKVALIYRKSVNKLVNVGPVSLSNNANSNANTSK